MREYGFAIVGGGVIMPWHASAIAALPNARLVAVVDAVPERAAARGAEYRVDSYTELDGMLSRHDVDVVCVCVPSGLHAEVGVRTAAAGKHVAVEKPIEVSLEAADRLVEACAANRVKLTVISQHRFKPAVQQLRKALDAGRLGQLVLGDAVVKWYRTGAYYESAGWRGTWALDGGGSLMNQAIHYVDLLRWVMGPVESVFARCRTAAHEIEVEDLALALLRFESGALGSILASTAIYPGLPERLEITGREGTVIIEDDEIRVWELKDEKGETPPYGVKLRSSSPPEPAEPRDRTAGHREQLADLLAAIDTDGEPSVGGQEARATLELLLAVYESARLGREVQLRPVQRVD